jgi:hypothetical protein
VLSGSGALLGACLDAEASNSCLPLNNRDSKKRVSKKRV